MTMMTWSLCVLMIFMYTSYAEWVYAYGLHPLDMMSREQHANWIQMIAYNHVHQGQLLAQFNNSILQSSIQFWDMHSHIMITAHSVDWSEHEINSHPCNVSLQDHPDHGSEQVGHLWYALYKATTHDAVRYFNNEIFNNHLFAKKPIVIAGYRIGGVLAQLFGHEIRWVNDKAPWHTTIKGVIAIDSPKVGNNLFSTLLCKDLTCVRIYTKDDHMRTNSKMKYLPVQKEYEISASEIVSFWVQV